MTQEEKQLLLKDLCARFPYGVKINHVIYNWEGTCINFNRKLESFAMEKDNGLCYDVPVEEVRPYLRPLLSMTEDEREEIEVFIFNEWYQENSCKIDNEGWIEILANYDVSGIDPCFCSDYVDWLNEHHFDYRGLIKKGLALEAPEGMYKTE